MGGKLHAALAKTIPFRLSPLLLMTRHMPLLLALGFTVFLLTAPRSLAGVTMEHETVAANQVLKLQTGRTIKILSVSKVEYSKGVMALMIRYQTTLSIDQHKALSDEVDDLWKMVVNDVERYGYSKAIISSNEAPKGVFITTNRALTFIFEKGSDGKWIRLNRADFLATQ